MENVGSYRSNNLLRVKNKFRIEVMIWPLVCLIIQLMKKNVSYDHWKNSRLWLSLQEILILIKL